MCDIFGMVRNSWTQLYVHMMYSNSNWYGRRVALEDGNKIFKMKSQHQLLLIIIVVIT